MHRICPIVITSFSNIIRPAGKRRRESGNVLFLILIAVALFAGLSFVVTQSTRSGSGSVSKEKARLAAAQILNFVSDLRTAYTRLTVNGCAKGQLNYYDESGEVISSWKEDGSDTPANPKAPPDHKCDIFRQEGAGVIPLKLDPKWQQAQSSPMNLKITVYTNELYNEYGEQVDITHLSEAICEALNEALGAGQHTPKEWWNLGHEDYAYAGGICMADAIGQTYFSTYLTQEMPR